jgi:hypothetical protein
MMLMFCSVNCFGASDWIPFVENITVYPTVEVPMVPSATYSNIVVNPNVVRYQWVPIFINRPVVISQSGLFIKRQQVIYQPTIEWVIQPVYR